MVARPAINEGGRKLENSGDSEAVVRANQGQQGKPSRLVAQGSVDCWGRYLALPVLGNFMAQISKESIPSSYFPCCFRGVVTSVIAYQCRARPQSALWLP